MLRIKLSARQLHDLKAIAKLGPEKLQRVLDRLEDLSTTALTPKAFRTALEHEIGEEPAHALSRQLLSLSSLHRAGDFGPEDVVDALAKEVENQLSESDLRSWRQASTLLGKMLGHPKVQITSKALELAFNYSDLLTGVDIITDLRPVFDAERECITGTLVTQTLRLRISSDGENKSLSIMMDEADIRRLQQLCATALRKAELAKDMMKGKCKVDAVIVGDDFYD